MSKTQKQTLILFIAFTLAGFLMSAGIAPSLEGVTQTLLIAAGMSLFGSGLTTFLINFLGAIK